MNTPIYNLAQHGDIFERHYWPLFIKDQFPSYERFWQKFIVPITNRPNDLFFKTNIELSKINKSESDICIAQLNYSIIRHLMRCFDISILLRSSPVAEQLDLLIEGICRLVGAQDNGFELLERFKTPNKYLPFKEKDGKKAREKWQTDNKYPLQTIRDYRNNLSHGRSLPGIIDVNRLCLPGIGKVDSYLDWRIITDPSNASKLNKGDFISVLTILESAHKETIDYLETTWKTL